MRNKTFSYGNLRHSVIMTACILLALLCVATIGSTTIRKCPKGFIFDEQFSSCADIDECADSALVCPEHDFCRNSFGSFECTREIATIQCPDGYQNFSSSCEDIDECTSVPDICDLESEHCFNYDGSYFCIPIKGVPQSDPPAAQSSVTSTSRPQMTTIQNYVIDELDTKVTLDAMECPKGTESIDGLTCEDIDECTTGNHTCFGQNICKNLFGAFECVHVNCSEDRPLLWRNGSCGENCDHGFVYSDFWRDCQDINECLDIVEPCPEDDFCVNELGTFRCVAKECGQGLRRPSYISWCVDIDECEEGTHDCNGSKVICSNTYASYECVCLDGFHKEFNETSADCVDIDECTEVETRACSPDATCTNIEGGFLCTCSPGFTSLGSWGECFDINECHENELICPYPSVCVNFVGTYYCRCPVGSLFDPFLRHCVEILFDRYYDTSDDIDDFDMYPVDLE